MLNLSKYTLIYPYKSKQYLVFNTLSNAVIKINKSLKEILENLPKEEKHLSEQSHIRDLLEKGIIINEDVDEDNKVQKKVDAIKHQETCLKVTILTTNKCNFGCPYCFESGIKGDKFLNDAAANKVIEWIIQRATLKAYKTINLCFYGGEPLLNLKAIKIISRKIKSWTKKNDLVFTMSMVSNGSLLTPAVVDILMPYGFELVQITLDGEKEHHDKSRPFLKGNHSSFDIVLKNITASVDKINIVLTINVDRNNLSGIRNLSDLLVKKGLHKKIMGVGFAPIMPSLSELKTTLSSETISDSVSIDELVKLQKEFAHKGFNTRRASFPGNSCSLLNEDSDITIDVNGDLYKCNVLIGHPEYVAGHISSQEYNKFHKKMVALSVWQMEECYSCAYLPLCNLGCRYKALVKNNDITAPICEKEIFEKTLPQWVELNYKNT